MTPQPAHITLSQLTGLISRKLSDAFAGQSYWVVADITEHSFKEQSGYHYFVLVEKDAGANRIIAKVKGAAWGESAKRILAFEETTGQKFTNNIHILVRVNVAFHDVFGLELTLVDISHSFTLGVIETKRQEALSRLVTKHPDVVRFRDGIYHTRNGSLALPPVIKRIAVLSSRTSAGNEDFLDTLQNNPYGFTFEVDSYFTVVQNEAFAGKFLEKLIEVYTSGIAYDAVVINRGGGAQTDFLIFDDFKIGLAVAKFPYPVITGIGHHKNETIADLMAHTRTKTPTEAAKFIITHNKAFADRLENLHNRIIHQSQHFMAAENRRFNHLQHRTVNRTSTLLKHRQQTLSELRQQLITRGTERINKAARHLQAKQTVLATSVPSRFRTENRNLSEIQRLLSLEPFAFMENRRSELRHRVSIINLLSPENILRKGFAIIKKDGEVTSDPAQLQPGTQLEIILRTRQITSVVQYNKENTDGTEFNLPAGI